MFYAQTTDPHLIESVKDWHDDANWRAFYDRYGPAIRHHALRSGLNDTESDDVLQEAMVKVARYLPSFEYDRTLCKFRTWLNQIVNQRIFEVRSRRKRSYFPRESLEEIRQQIHQSQAPVENPVDQVETEYHLLEACLARVRARVKARHWQLFEAHAIHGMSSGEVADLHKTTKSNVWVVRHRLVKYLRQEWGQLLEKPFDEKIFNA